MNFRKLLCLPVQASTQAPQIDQIIIIIHVFILLLALGWGSYFVYTLFRFRSSYQKKAVLSSSHNHITSYIESGILIFEIVLLVVFSIPFWSNVITKFPSSKKALTVRVVAQQYAWNIHYPGPDNIFGRTAVNMVNSQTNPIGIDRNDVNGRDDIVTVNQLVIPINKPLIVQLSSLDVIHCFGIPAMRVKQDVLPGMQIPTWFQPTKIGTYEIMCAQLCGLGHYRMRGFVKVKNKQDFDSWMEEKIKETQDNDIDTDQDSFWS